MFYGEVSWEIFAAAQNGASGIRTKFENLCRQLFVNEFLSDNKENKYVHCDPNHPGIESEPVYDEKNKRWIGFQAKFFDNNVSYRQIKDSAVKIIEYYSGKIDVVYLFCNKSITKSSDSYIDILKLLADHNITLIPIDDEAILDLARKYPNLAKYYFDVHGITMEWIDSHNERMMNTKGVRYNYDFNINTDSSLKLSLFACDSEAISYINSKKMALTEKIDSLGWKYKKYNDYLNKLKKLVLGIDDVNYDNITESFNWKNIAEDELRAYIYGLKKEREKLEIELEKAHKKAFGSEVEKISVKNDAKSEYFELKNKADILLNVLDLTSILEIEEHEKDLIASKVLAVTGEAGIGKSQLFANEVKVLGKEERCSIIFLGGLYLTNEPIENQIVKECSLDHSFEYLLSLLETIGAEKDKDVIIFIDALNETWHKQLWKVYLPTIISCVERFKNIKLAFSYRTEYKSTLLSNRLLDRFEEGSIYELKHYGFYNNTVEAIKEFFNYYSIPFTASEFFEYQMANPLFLTLYCRTWKKEADVSDLYNRILRCANTNIHRSLAIHLIQCGYDEKIDLVSPFVDELADFILVENRKFFTQEELLNLSFWRVYNNLTQPVFIKELVKENILHSYMRGDKEVFYFAYDQMNDYYCAKHIVASSKSVDDVKLKLIDILDVNEFNRVNFGNKDLFVNVCMLCSIKFKEECLDLLDDIDDDFFKRNVIESYIESYQWRDKNNISTKEFRDLIKKYPVSKNVLWETLVVTSVRVNHPLNAFFLNKFLKGFTLNKRDRLWTTYINNIWGDESNRLVQLIDMYNCGSCLEMDNKEQKKLLLILLGWLLTASNRKLRDYTSKAMVEILKNDFDLCEGLLATFNGVDDPYVVQRLYGIVFGACCKRTVDDYNTYLNLAEYVYSSIFNQEYIYPDILLRDYARLIIERFLWEYPDYKGIIVKERILPPYKSYDIPVVEEDYSSRDTYYKFDYGTQMILSSMRFETMGGMYGDFGRYVFQSALRNFDVDLKQIYNYSISFIINELSYKDEWFTDYDNRAEGYNNPRYNGPRNERIGKKYQWIAMYNILARVSDNCKMIEPYSTDEKELRYEGPWEPYVRDFDPTLNCDIKYNLDVPKLKQFDEFIDSVNREISKVNVNDDVNQNDWLNDEGCFYENLGDVTVMKDDNDVEWISLSKYLSNKFQDLLDGKPFVWGWVHAYFVTQKQCEDILEYANKGIDIRNETLKYENKIYTLFNGEYPWAPSCKSVLSNAKINAVVNTGEKETKFYKTFDFDIWDEEGDVIISDDSTSYTYSSYEKNVEFEIGEILCANTELSWEEEFDMTKDNTISLMVPCSELINKYNLKKFANSSLYYDEYKNLAAFDTHINLDVGCVVVRKDIIDNFLKEENLILIWVLEGAKELHRNDYSTYKCNYWTGVITYDGSDLRKIIYKASSDSQLN